MGFLSIFHIYKLLFLGSDGLADNYPFINGAISRFRGVADNYSYIHCAISRFKGVV